MASVPLLAAGTGAATNFGELLALSAEPAIAGLLIVVVPAELASRHLTASAIGFMVLGADAVGATLGPVLAGLLADGFGLKAPLIMAAVTMPLVGVIVAGLPETAPRRLRESRP